MSDSAVWDVLVGAGTTLTLTVIVMIALALNALALFYLSSAVVVLERFARPVKRSRWVLFFGVIAIGGASFLMLRELATQDGVAALTEAPWLVVQHCAILVTVSIGVCVLALRWHTTERGNAW